MLIFILKPNLYPAFLSVSSCTFSFKEKLCKSIANINRVFISSQIQIREALQIAALSAIQWDKL